MALSYSVDKTDGSGRELLTYGTSDFPIAFFDDDLTKVKVPWHWHDEFEIIIITEGSVCVQIANSSFVLNKGEGYFLNSGILHSAKLLSKKGHQHALIFSPEITAHSEDIVWKTYIQPIFKKQALPFIKLSPGISWQNSILQLSNDAWLNGAYEKTDYPITIRHNLTRIFSLIKSNIDSLENETEFTHKAKQDELRIKKILFFIENNYPTTITIADIAKSGDISISSCLRLFKQILKTTPIQYLIKYRLQKAVEEFYSLKGRNIGDIAYSCGFSDATYFNRCFKKEFGCTPTEYMAKKSA